MTIVPVPTTASFPPYLVEVPVTISSGGTASGIIDTNGMVIAAVRMPAAWTAATLGIESGATATTAAMQPVYKRGESSATLYTEPVTTGGIFPIDAYATWGVRYARLISGHTTTSVAQGGDRVITVVLRYF
jgi:hypothetical protein